MNQRDNVGVTLLQKVHLHELDHDGTNILTHHLLPDLVRLGSLGSRLLQYGIKRDMYLEIYN